MKHRNRNTVIVGLIGALLLSTSAVAATAADFSDFPTDWSAPAMTQAVENGLLNGDNGKLNPAGSLTRAEMAAIVNRAFGATATASLAGFQDVSPSAWYYTDMAKAVKMGTFYGDNGKLNPNDPITREEAFAVLARAFALENGSASSLSSFSDQKAVSSWAAGSLAALVSQGYVSGANGSLNPQAQITRAEFAQVMSNMASTYVGQAGAKTTVLQGNVVVRESGASLSGLTVQGDLILADGAKNVSLDNVTVTGRILIRGGEGSVKATATSAAQGTVVANPNGTVSLSAANCSLGTVSVQSDLSLAAGQLDQVTIAKTATVTVQKDAKVASVTAEAENAKITGAGQVTAVQANADNVTVTNPGAKVTAAAGVTGTQAGDKTVAPGQSATVPAATTGSTGGGGSTSGSSSGGSSTPTAATIVNAEKASVITTDAGCWLPLVFADGFNTTNTTVTVDGKDVTAYASNVLTDGSIAKLPLVSTPGTVTLTSGSKTQTINLGGTGGDAVYTGTGYLADYYLAHGPIAIWDYYLTNYDDAGDVRILPAQTTFSTKAAANPHPSYSPVTVLEDGNSRGNVVIMFNYQNADAKDGDEAWFDNIGETGALELVSYDQYKTVLNDHLTYTKGTTDHGGTVGTLTIPFNQTNFTSNGRYYVRVCSTGENGAKTYALVPIHVVNHDAPTLAIRETPESGRNLHFTVRNMVYGIVDPVERVTLTKPNGTTIEVPYLEDCYLWSQDLFVLYNDNTNYLDQKGTYTITIEAAGFQDFSCQFYVADGDTPAAATAPRGLSIDALSGSTSGGSSGDASSGGSYAISANLLFDSDLLANALVLEKLGLDADIAAAATILDYWKSNTISDAVFNVGDTSYYAWSGYISAVNAAQVNGNSWLPFAQYRNAATATFAPPHATKAILEDGLLGEIQDSSVSGKLDAVEPDVSGNQQGQNVVLTFENAKDYLSNINGLIYLNGDWRELSNELYTLNEETGTITFQARCFTVGKENSITIKSAGYKSQDVTFTYEKVNETSLSLTATPAEDKVTVTVSGSNGDFLRQLSSVTLTNEGKTSNVWTQGVSGADAPYYALAEDNRSLDLYNVTPGTYTVTVAANYYDDPLTATFTVVSDGDIELLPVPNANPTGEMKDGNYFLSFGISGGDTWKQKISTVQVNGVTYTEQNYMEALQSSLSDQQYAWKEIAGGGTYGLVLHYSNFDAKKENTVVIQATGYETLTLNVNGSDGSVITDSTDVPTTKQPPSIGSIESKGGSNWLDVAYYRITLTTESADTLSAYFEKDREFTVKVGETTYSRSILGLSFNDSNSFFASNGTLDLTKDGFSTTGNTTVTVEVPGYETLTFIVDENGKLVTDGDVTDPTPDPELKPEPEPEPEPGTSASLPTNVEIKKVQSQSYYQLTFQDASDWFSKIEAITVDDVSCEKETSVYNLQANKFFLDSESNSIYIQFPSAGWMEDATYTMVISAEELEPLTLEITIPYSLFDDNSSVSIKTPTP